jgi:hypothetical protein
MHGATVRKKKVDHLHTAGQNSAKQFQPNRRFATFCCKDKDINNIQAFPWKGFLS